LDAACPGKTYKLIRIFQAESQLCSLKVVPVNRVDVLRRKTFEVKGFDGFLLTNEFNICYFTGCPGLMSLLVPKAGRATIYAYSVNYQQARAMTKGFDVQMLEHGQTLVGTIAKQVRGCRIKKLAFDALSIDSYRELAKGLRGVTRLMGRGDLVAEIRRVKDEAELDLMRKAADLASIGIKVAYEVIRPGVKEYEVAAEVEYAMRRKGSWGVAFDTIVASGVRSAFPHGGGGSLLGGGCTDKRIRNGDLVVVDVGALYQHYRSDITRTLVAGKPSAKQEKLYEIVKAAHDRAFRTMRSEVKANAVDAAARKVIVDAGYGDFFVHGLGHGVGLEVHEGPTLSSMSKDELTVGNVVTDEPGIYLPGYGGVRVEDTVLVRKAKAECLTSGPMGLGLES
jgi:Xaa-Pro aminopeptidase